MASPITLAAELVKDTGLLMFQDGSVTLDGARNTVCWNAIREIGFMAVELGRLVPDDGISDALDMVCSLTARLKKLSSVLKDALDNPMVGTNELEVCVTRAKPRRLRG